MTQRLLQNHLQVYLKEKFVFVPVKIEFVNGKKKTHFLFQWGKIETISPDIFIDFVFPQLSFESATHVAILLQPSGLCVFDFDNTTDMPSDFVQKVIDYAERESIPFVRSGRGIHLYFKSSEAASQLPPQVEIGGGKVEIRRSGVIFAPLFDNLNSYYRWIIPIESGNLRELTDRDLQYLLPQNSVTPSAPLWVDKVVSLIKPHWLEGQRHNLALALAGVFAKRGIPREHAELVFKELIRLTNDPEMKDRIRTILDTYDRLAEGESVLAWQGLEQILDEATLRELDRILPNYNHRNGSVTFERPERPCTDLGNAERLVRLFGDKIRYVPQWGWMVWDGKRWVRDQNNQRIMAFAEATVREIYKEAAEATDPEERTKLAKFAIASESRQRIAAMIELAAPMCLASPEEFDADDWLLNLENGVLDLRTLELMPHDPKLRLTKLAPVAYDPTADYPKWKAFLNRIFNNNERLIRFVQRAVAYSLTGSTREQCLFFLYGTGANGKSTFLEVIRTLCGDYAATAEFSTFVADKKSSVRNDIARLHNARLVTAIEVGEGRRFAEELIKTLTGGDTIAARFLYREYFEFKPKFKVWLAANYKPEIRGTDYAIWRRIRLIPFTVTIPPEEQIPDLADQLKEELSGILNWVLKGLQDWLNNGLQPPPEVNEATEAYRLEMDVVGLFIQDACVLDPKAVTPSKELYEVFKEWCAENGYEPCGQNAFGRRLTARGFKSDNHRVGADKRVRRCWIGIRLKSDTPPPELDFQISENFFNESDEIKHVDTEQFLNETFLTNEEEEDETEETSTSIQIPQTCGNCGNELIVKKNELTCEHCNATIYFDENTIVEVDEDQIPQRCIICGNPIDLDEDNECENCKIMYRVRFNFPF